MICLASLVSPFSALWSWQPWLFMLSVLAWCRSLNALSDTFLLGHTVQTRCGNVPHIPPFSSAWSVCMPCGIACSDSLSDGFLSSFSCEKKKRIFHAAAIADVFGAMGSWNDSPPCTQSMKNRDV